MYGYEPDPYPYRDYYGRYDPEGTHASERLRLVAYVDGRFVETWTEPVGGSPWAEVAERFDREHVRPDPAPVPTCERVLSWLDDVCGGREAVLALGSAELVEDSLDLPEVDTPQGRSRLSAVAELLDAVAARCFDAETSFALRAALLKVWAKEPDVITDAASAAHVAGGIAWLVAKANGLLRPQGVVTVGSIKEALALHPTPSTYGKVLQRTLVGYRDLAPERSRRLHDLPELLPVGHPDLLVASTRRALVKARDRALEAQAESTAA